MNPTHSSGQKFLVPFIITVILFLAALGAIAFLLTQEINSLAKENKELKSELAVVKEKLKTMEKPNKTVTPNVRTNYYPVKYNKFSNEQQKVAQTFRLGEDKVISSLILRASFGVGNDLEVTLYGFVDAKNLEVGPVLVSATLPATEVVREPEFKVDFRQQVRLGADTDYVFVVESKDQFTQTGIAYSEGDVDGTGSMYVFTRLIGGNGEILDNRHSWQPKYSQDVFYRFE